VMNNLRNTNEEVYNAVNNHIQSRQEELLSSLEKNSDFEGKSLLINALKNFPLCTGTDFVPNLQNFDVQLQAWKDLHHYAWEV